MDVQKARFPFELVKIIHDVADSHFIALDLEFSGVAGRRPTTNGGKLTLQQLYDDVKEAAEKYQVLQVGLTIVKQDSEKGIYVARPYNFNINPLPTLKEHRFNRDWSFNSGAVAFLLRNGFKFDLPYTQGIPYLSRKEEDLVRSAWIQDDEKRDKMSDMVTKTEDAALIAHIRNTISKWQAQKREDQAEYQNIPAETREKGIPESLNRYQMRLTHQIVRNAYPKLKTTGMSSFIQVTNPTEEQQASEKAEKARYREREIANAVGFRWLIEAIIRNDIGKIPDEYLFSALSSDVRPANGEAPLRSLLESLQVKLHTRRRVLVGHNCFTDLVNLYRCFIGDLPDQVEDFQIRIHELFPAIIDTKLMATFIKKWNTSLEEVEQGLRAQALPVVEVPAEFDRYQHTESYHEAGYDSLLTAKIAIKLSAKMAMDGSYKSEVPKELDSQPFGLDEDKEHATAAESNTSNDSSTSRISRTLTETLTAPMTVVKSFFQTDTTARSKASSLKVEEHHESKGNSAKESAPSQPQGTSSASVIAVRQKPIDWSKPQEVKKLKKAFDTSNIFDVLREESSKSGNGSTEEAAHDGVSDVFNVSNDEERTPVPKQVQGSKDAARKVGSVASKGEMMPQWDGEDGFWQVFGNRLQVNGSQEGECRLHEIVPRSH